MKAAALLGLQGGQGGEHYYLWLFFGEILVFLGNCPACACCPAGSFLPVLMEQCFSALHEPCDSAAQAALSGARCFPTVARTLLYVSQKNLSPEGIQSHEATLLSDTPQPYPSLLCLLEALCRSVWVRASVTWPHVLQAPQHRPGCSHPAQPHAPYCPQCHQPSFGTGSPVTRQQLCSPRAGSWRESGMLETIWAKTREKSWELARSRSSFHEKCSTAIPALEPTHTPPAQRTRIGTEPHLQQG